MTPPQPPKTRQHNAFITAKKGFCYLAIKIGRRNFHIMRIRNYTLEAEDKRHMRRLHPDTVFDWKKLTQQLAAKRELCRQYRSRRRTANTHQRTAPEPFYAVYEPRTRTVYVDGGIAETGALLDAILEIDRRLDRKRSEPRFDLRFANPPGN